MSMKELMAAGNSLASGDTPEGVSFDGSNDYLSRSSVLSGSSDTVKTLTLSVWVYYDPIPAVDSQIVRVLDIRQGSSSHVAFQLRVGSYGTASVNAEYGSSWGQAINDVYNDSSTPDAGVPQSGWNHILYSVDLNNTTSAMYINDVLANPSTDGSSLANQPMLFTTYGADINVGRQYGGNYYMKGRLAHLFLDFTYRNLSTVSNRRLFIDSDGKPSSTIPSSPILYLPMTDAATAGSNSGTGGDFTVNGVLDTAGRAPNQFNCSASEFDGSNDYMSRGSANYGSAQKSTGSVLFNASSDSSGQRLFSFDGDDGQINVNPSGGEIDILYKVNPWSGIMLAQIATNLSVNRNYSLQWSFDTSDTGKRHFYLNGVSVLSSTTFSYYDNSTTALYGNWGIGATSTGSSKFTGSIGELWFEWDVYRDLSSDNPFWDSDTNLPKPVRQVIDETGTTPLMAVPMRGDNAGINLGTDDNFTVRSGPYTGARGGSEFWARSAKFETSNSDYMGRGSLSGVGSSSSAFTTVGYYRRGTLDGDRYFGIGHENTVYRFKIEVHQSSTQIDLRLSARNSSGTEIMGFSGQNITTDYVIFLLSFDTNSSGSQTAYIYSDAGLINDTSNWGIYNLGSNWDMSDYTALGGTYGQGTGGTGYGTLDGDMGFFYLDDSYIDFSQESNRNLFVDQLGYPKDLTPAIEAGDIAEPLIYMKFDDTSALGTNSGTGGDFSTINGTITAGADVNPNA